MTGNEITLADDCPTCGVTVALYRERIAALEAENAALKAQIDEAAKDEQTEIENVKAVCEENTGLRELVEEALDLIQASDIEQIHDEGCAINHYNLINSSCSCPLAKCRSWLSRARKALGKAGKP